MTLAVENLKNFLEHIDSFSPGIKPHDDMPVRGYAPQSWLTIGDLREVLRLAQKAGDNPVTGAIREIILTQAGSGFAVPPSKPCCPLCGQTGNAIVHTGTKRYPWECLPCGKVFA